MLSEIKSKICISEEQLLFNTPRKSETHIVSFLNPYSYIISRKKKIFNLTTEIGIDGILLVWLLNFFRICRCKRISFDMTSLAKLVLKNASECGTSIYLIGTKSELIEQTIANIRKLFPKINIVGYRHGYFKDPNEKTAIVNRIIDLSPGIVITGMGTPLQEEFLIDLANSGWKGIGYTCGGFLHQTASKARYYPDWIDKFNLRWAYRVYDEPNLWYRYLVIYPFAVAVFIFDWVKFKFNH